MRVRCQRKQVNTCMAAMPHAKVISMLVSPELQQAGTTVTFHNCCESMRVRRPLLCHPCVSRVDESEPIRTTETGDVWKDRTILSGPSYKSPIRYPKRRPLIRLVSRCPPLRALSRLTLCSPPNAIRRFVLWFLALRFPAAGQEGTETCDSGPRWHVMGMRAFRRGRDRVADLAYMTASPR
ncbi:hypothetical protein VUR80DRAFT_2623 [Thermomyces stellatus]